MNTYWKCKYQSNTSEKKCTLRSSTKFEKLLQSAPRKTTTKCSQKAYYKVLPEELTTECSRREAFTQAQVRRKTLSPHLSHSVFAEVIGNQSNSTLSLFGILLLCRDDIAYLSEDQSAARKGRSYSAGPALRRCEAVLRWPEPAVPWRKIGVTGDITVPIGIGAL